VKEAGVDLRTGWRLLRVKVELAELRLNGALLLELSGLGLTSTGSDLERELVACAKGDDLAAFYRLRSVPGIGEILAMTIFYEVPDFDRFDTVQQFASYARLVAPRGESAGKLAGASGRKQGNVHLKWAFSEAAVLLLRNNPRAQKAHSRLVARFGKAKALSVLAHKLGRAIFHMQKRQQPFDAERFYREA
jgi:transposase